MYTGDNRVMAEFQYKIVKKNRISIGDESLLNKLGEEGWQLVTAATQAHADDVYIFMRVLSEEEVVVKDIIE